MHPQYPFPTITLSFMIIKLTLIHFPSSLYANDYAQYLNCSASFECAGIENLGYPFWGSNRPDYCGHPGFELNCSADAPQINIALMNYRVLEINNVSRTLKVARADYWNTICPAEIVNTTTDFTIFSYASDTTNLTLYYDCYRSMYVTPDPPFAFEFDCLKTSTDATNCYVNSTNPSSWWNCKYSVKVPVLQSAAQTVERNTTEAALIEAIDGGFMLGWDANDTRCEECQSSRGQCGFNPSTNEFACHCTNGTFPLVCESTAAGHPQTPTAPLQFIAPSPQFTAPPQIVEPSFHTPSTQKWQLIIAIGIPTGVAGIAVISFLIICSVKRGHLSSNAMVCCKRDAKNDHINAEETLKNYGSIAPKRYTYSDVKKLTNSFKDKVGQGGYGVVYKGKLPDGHIVAVKILSESKGNGEEFINEVASISRTSHVNIVTLLGFCYERSKRALIYEFVPNGSLDKFIYNKGSSTTDCHLDSKTMFQIALGIARGLEYLHRGCRTRILHFDIKPHNILLDEDLCPKISDFGLAKLCKTKESIVSMSGMRGTVGYIAPEVFRRCFGGVSHKSDVYSYGMLVLDMVGERKKNVGEVSHSSEIYFPEYIYKKLEQGEVFGTFGEITSEEEDTVKKMTIVSLWCIQTNPSDRPSMDRVIEMLQGTLHSLQCPPKPSL